MKNLYRKKLGKIYRKINNIAIKGRDNELEFYKYIDELIESGDYSLLEEVLLQYYQIDTSVEQSIELYKRKAWNEICFQTKPSFLSKLSLLYKSNNIYQQSYDIYLNGLNISIGQILEKEIYTNDTKYLIKNSEFAKLIGEKLIYLEVIKSNGETLIIDNYNPNITIDQNLLDKYKVALEFLLDAVENI
jgi:hypothetical protein